MKYIKCFYLVIFNFAKSFTDERHFQEILKALKTFFPQSASTTSDGDLHEHFLLKLEQFWLFHMRDFCIYLFILSAFLTGLK